MRSIMMRKNRICRLTAVFFFAVVFRAALAQPQQWNVLPLPDSTMNIKSPVRSLNGVWKLTLTPPEKFWDTSAGDNNWSDVVVPGEPAMQGLKVEHDRQFAYRRQFTVPKEFSGQRVFLRFDGVYSYAKVWINGQYLREHFGGFTSWDCEITDYVKPGQEALLAVGVVDRIDDISFASGYAKHPIGGILRGVYVYCLPKNYIRNFDVETQLDEDYQDAVLKVSTELSSKKSAILKLSLVDSSGKKVPLKPNRIKFKEEQGIADLEINVRKPLKWDAEHPNLYTLTAELKQGLVTTEKIVQKIGFREVEVRGNKIRVNGQPVHLRGANRHDIHPTLGRTSGKELDLQDVLLAKEANINFIRTSHYPPSKAFLEYCDQYGIYIEEETAANFVGQSGGSYGSAINGSQHKPEFTDRYLSQIAEMVIRDRKHPSVIIWSIGNENRYGINFQKSYDLVKELDASRPVIFSYPATAGDNVCYEIESLHYPTWTGSNGGGTQWPIKNFQRLQRPVIGDEWAHVACYNTDFIKRDPGVRNFWGESMRGMWENAFVSNGTAGGAIWGMIDETFQLPDKCVGYGEWGIYDTWRRKKPEFWLTKKAYSPIRIDEGVPVSVSDAKNIKIPVKNWFDHTNFSELLIQWQIGEQSGEVKTSLVPGKEGQLVIPAKNVKQDAVVHLRFYDQFAKQRRLVDEFKLPVGVKKARLEKLSGPAPQLKQNDNEITIAGSDFQIIFDKKQGVIKKGVFNDRTLIVGGPSLNLTPFALSPFVLKEINAGIDNEMAKIHITGNYDTIEVTYDIRIDGQGVIETKYTVVNPPEKSNSYHEVGLAFDLVGEIDLLQWDRNGFYSTYPDDHIGRNAGSANKVSVGKEGTYRQRPDWSWSHDMYDFFYMGSDHQGYGMTHDFRSAKANIYHAVVSDSKTGHGLKVESDGQSHAVRIGISPEQRIIDDKNPDLVYVGNWEDYQDGGNYSGTEKFASDKGSSVEYCFSGTSVEWIGTKNSNGGKVDIYLDGKIVKEGFDLYASGKQYRKILYSNTNLPDTKHTIKIVCKGAKAEKSSGSYVAIDGFTHPNTKDERSPIRMHISAEWAYGLGWGNMDRQSSIESGFADTIVMRFVRLQ